MNRWYPVLAASACLAAMAQPAAAQPAASRIVAFDIPAGGLKPALDLFARQSGVQLLYRIDDVEARRTAGVHGAMNANRALDTLLQDTGLQTRRDSSGAIGIVAPPPRQSPPEVSATGDIIVTAQKREQKIQDVPIAISAFSGKTLDAMKIETGADLLKSIPNVTFSKNNFTGYNFSIRGIGTKAVAVSTDPAVAVAFNSSNLITNRLFEQEFFDIERVEVLRGPQGTLYGRNATAGVVNIISNKANLTKPEGFLKLETGSFATKRISGAANMPIVEDRLALRVAGAYTKRDGFAINDIYDKRIDGRDLFSTRITISARPIDPLRFDLIWERFNENDDRQRAGKQLCHKDPGPSEIAGFALTEVQRANFSQGCKDGSLYDDDAYSTPNGLSLNAWQALNSLGLSFNPTTNEFTNTVKVNQDPYGNLRQSRDLRRFSAIINPTYRAKADVLEANATLDLGKVSVVSQTVYDADRYASTEDYNRYASVPIFNDTQLTPGGVYNDPQLGPSNLFVGGDLIRSRSHQLSQEVRFQSADPTSPLQYVVGANYTHFRNDTDYNVYINTLTPVLEVGLVPALTGCSQGPGESIPGCAYIDPNPIGKGPADGHNYFRSVNPYRLSSWGAFADINYALSSNFKLIAGIRENRDRKSFDQVPSQLLLSIKPILSGFVDRGYPTVGVIDQSWNKVTGRAGFQWTPELSFTDKTMAYFTYSRGYKAGGANPPGVGFGSELLPDGTGGYGKPNLSTPPDGAFSLVQGTQLATIFKPEFLNAFELGVKNTALGGKLTFDATAFYYDYKDYQVSQIIDRSSQNQNFDATVWGLEFEAAYNPFRNLSFNANLGYERSRIAKGERSIDVLNRTQGRPGYYLVKPFVQLPSNCVVNEAVIAYVIQQGGGDPASSNLQGICQGAAGFSNPDFVNPANYPDVPGGRETLYPNNGQGFYADLTHNELPNTPHLTFNLGGQYTVPLGNDWAMIGRVDFYHQSSSYARVYNDRGDRLRGWENTNVSLRLGNQRLKLLAEFYVKNVFDAAPISDAFVNSDDTGLPTNVFTLDPRIFGVNITKGF